MIKPSTESISGCVLEALRESTRALHKNLESMPAMARLFQSDYTMSEYRAHLGQLLGLFEPLEASARHAAETEGSSAPPARAGDLRDDLLAMGATQQEIDAFRRCDGLAPIPAAGLSGYTYVILGSMIGGRVIVKQLREALGSAASFRFYGDENHRYPGAWALFRADLEAAGSVDIPAICGTAVSVFGAFADWFSRPAVCSGGR